MKTDQTLGTYAKTPWSWGRMHDILSEGRKIESCRQLRNEKREREKKREKWIEFVNEKTKKGAPANDQ